MPEPRAYRGLAESGRLKGFTLSRGETDLWIGVDPGSYDGRMPAALGSHIAELRAELMVYAAERPVFLGSFEPLPQDRAAPRIVRSMLAASALAGVGPMAAVAGAFSDAAAAYLKREFRCREVVVENGGDIALLVESPVDAAILAGRSPLSGKLAVRAGGPGRPAGLATSAGRAGHSYSAGRADACLALAKDAATADAFATAFGNRVGSAADIESALELGARTPGLEGLALIVGEAFGCVGRLEIRPMASLNAAG